MVWKPKTKVIKRPQNTLWGKLVKAKYKVKKDWKLDTWRPTKKTPEVLEKLQEAFWFKCTEEEACAYAGIHFDTLHDRMKNDKEFSDKIQLWKNAYIVNIKKASYQRAMNTKNKDSTEILMKVDKDFSDKVEVKWEVTLVDAIAMLKQKRLEQQEKEYKKS